MNAKRKIEDYKGKDVAIYCSTKKEWNKIVDLLPSNKTVKKIYWQNSVNDGKSDTININGFDWSPKKHFENKGYTIYPASDFLEEEKPFKFNIGDEIKAKPGGYYISSPHHFAESHKKQFPSEKSSILGKIIERTQAQGFNWYRCDYGNWITEEGVELVKEDIPEYVEYIDTKYKGQIVKVEDWKWSSYCKVIFANGTKEQPFKHLVKPSTKEAFDLQNKPKTINEDVFCIELNSQEELDAIMDFYKQKGFKELGNSHEYFNDYVVCIKMEDKVWQTSVYNGWNYPVKTLSELGIEVKSKPLVGRYLKALVDNPQSTSIKKGEYVKILDFYYEDKKPNKYRTEGNWCYTTDNSTSNHWELMPEGFKSEDDLISEAKRRYPIGTKFRPAHTPDKDVLGYYCIVTEDSVFEKYGDQIVLTVNGEYWIYRENPKYGNTDYNRIIYYQGKWAEIVSDGQGINTYGLKVGDILKKEVINAWAYIQGNFCPDVQKGWVDVFQRYGEGRKIEDFRVIEGQVGFHVSGCTEGTHYLKAEGFKEFADNFYKKEAKSWIQKQEEMLDDAIKQHPLTPKECYLSNDLIIPQVIKAQKTIQKITIESPTELDLKLKTIKPKQIQTIKI